METGLYDSYKKVKNKIEKIETDYIKVICLFTYWIENGDMAPLKSFDDFYERVKAGFNAADGKPFDKQHFKKVLNKIKKGNDKVVNFLVELEMQEIYSILEKKQG